ncbi:hypothetical protein BCR39DRAFT_375890 [Naematelia encephala]|uniref:Uncharacterized protein n=1 Tax=Naematelia encephala TaxID=71784 RepID=A0A1Y2BCH0_9TREE|nr:hypothetical protein BCR39DRAFT_375890 [Naematelia encephala]
MPSASRDDPDMTFPLDTNLIPSSPVLVMQGTDFRGGFGSKVHQHIGRDGLPCVVPTTLRRSEGGGRVSATLSFVSCAIAPTGLNTAEKSRWNLKHSLWSCVTADERSLRLEVPISNCNLYRPHFHRLTTTQASVSGSNSQGKRTSWIVDLDHMLQIGFVTADDPEVRPRSRLLPQPQVHQKTD